MMRPKGSTIATWDCYAIIPLLNWNTNQTNIGLLPKFPSLPEFFSFDRFLSHYDEPTGTFLRKLSKRAGTSDYFVASIVVALHFLTVVSASNSDDRHWSKYIISDEEDIHFPISLLTSSWKLVHDKISFDEWKHLVANVLRNIHIVNREHPLIDYSRDFIPYMSMSELEEVVTILKLETKCRSTVGIQQIVQQFCRNEPVPTFVIFSSLDLMTHTDNDRNKPSINAIKHSCLPTAQLDLNDDRSISLKAQFDIASDDDASICYVIDDDTVEQRDKMLQCRMGQSCLCVRCRYELTADTGSLSHKDLIHIGHFLMIKEDFKKAKAVYREALRKTLSLPFEQLPAVLPDVYHALGAVELSMGNFIQAQHIWRDADREFPELCRSHDGIALQLKKIKSYTYFDVERRKCILDCSVRWDSAAPDCCIASVLGSETCRKVIDWAETFGKWTTKRHYAVPTFDLPIHTVPPLLDWFQNDFMKPIVQPLLEQQFKPSTEGRFYVHDAFCVRYESNAAANHLPIHVDESTHSLVVALNDDFDGGGTYFPDYDLLLRPSKGSIISFRGDSIPHGGQAVTRGVRYILAVFLYYDIHCDKISEKTPIATKHDQPEWNQHLRKPKQQKTDFSFDFNF